MNSKSMFKIHVPYHGALLGLETLSCRFSSSALPHPTRGAFVHHSNLSEFRPTMMWIQGLVIVCFLIDHATAFTSPSGLIQSGMSAHWAALDLLLLFCFMNDDSVSSQTPLLQCQCAHYAHPQSVASPCSRPSQTGTSADSPKPLASSTEIRY